jgi:hypothetical protein
MRISALQVLQPGLELIEIVFAGRVTVPGGRAIGL